jgi:hypothetical protein
MFTVLFHTLPVNKPVASANIYDTLVTLLGKLVGTDVRDVAPTKAPDKLTIEDEPQVGTDVNH